MKVLDDQQQSMLLRGYDEQGEHRLEKPEAGIRGVRAVGNGGLGSQLRKQPRQLSTVNTKTLAKRVDPGCREVVADRLQEGQVGERELGLRTGALHHRRPDPVGPHRQLRAEPALAHARVAGQHHDRALAAAGRQEGVLEVGKLLLPADQDAAYRAGDHGSQIIGSVCDLQECHFLSYRGKVGLITLQSSAQLVLVKIALPERLRIEMAPIPVDVEVGWYSDNEGCVRSVAGAEVLLLDFSVSDLERVFEAGTSLRWVATAATGVDSWPLRLFESHGVVLTNGAGIGAIPISEYVVMGLLAGLKGLPDLVRAQDRGEWLSAPPRLAELHGKRALIYGYGSIGRAIADRLRSFGVTVVGVRRHPDEEDGVVGAANWQVRLPDTDLLILSVPLTGMTRSLVGDAELTALPPGAWVANIARGALIDEAALINALKSGRLGGAYLDVTESEPLAAESELWSLPNVILTAHSSWATDRLTLRSVEMFRDNLDRYQRGEPLRNVVDLGAGY
jgi:phosphoglycerate dehydrogenase-like enzyme